MSTGPPEDHPRDILQAHGLAASRRFGQNFLVSAVLMDRVVEEARVAAEAVVLEIGTGIGRLTERLAARAAAVVSVEIDRGLAALARGHLAQRPNVVLLHADFLEAKHRINPDVTAELERVRAGRPVKVVSNLPYQISSPAIVNILEWSTPVSELDVMLQAEVADRLAAGPATPDYGPLSVIAAYWSRMERLFRVGPDAFWPQPAVSSEFVRIVPRPPGVRARDYGAFASAVSALFQCRRKSLAAALRIGWGKAASGAVLEATGLDRDRRPDTLSVEDFLAIADALPEPEEEETDAQ